VGRPTRGAAVCEFRCDGSSDADRAAAAEARQATLDKLHAQLSDGVLALNNPQAWQAWLTFASRFH